MARRKYNFHRVSRRPIRSRKSRRSASKYTAVERAAYQFGLVQRGLDNPDSRITAAYERGKRKPQRKPKKSLF